MIDHSNRLRRTKRRYLNDNNKRLPYTEEQRLPYKEEQRLPYKEDKRLPYKEDQERQQYVLRNTPNFERIVNFELGIVQVKQRFHGGNTRKGARQEAGVSSHGILFLLVLCYTVFFSL